MSAETPLQVSIENDELVIRIGINVLKFGTEEMESNNPWDDQSGDFRRLYNITQPLEFAKDVKAELEREEEDGTTPLHLLLDRVCMDAIEQGSMAVEDLKRK